jgi:hypothetical protein
MRKISCVVKELIGYELGLCMGEDRGLHRVLVGKPEGKRPLGRPRRRWEDNIKILSWRGSGGLEGIGSG